MAFICICVILATAVGIQDDICSPGSSCNLDKAQNNVIPSSLLQAATSRSQMYLTRQERHRQATPSNASFAVDNATLQQEAIARILDATVVSHMEQKEWSMQATPSDAGLIKNVTLVSRLAHDNAPVCGLIWFLHLGKCGGVSVADWMYKQKDIGGFQEVYNLMSRGPIKFGQWHDSTLQPWISNMKGKLVGVAHHHNGPGLYGMGLYFSKIKQELNAQGCSLVRYTVLREPVARLVSNVNFDMQLSRGNSGARVSVGEHNEFFRKWLPVSGANDFQNRYDNYQVRYILNNFGNADGTSKFPMPFGAENLKALNAAIHILDEFELVGIMEEMDKSIDKLSELFALKKIPPPHSNERKKEFQKHDDLPPPGDVQALLAARTTLEMKLYERYNPALKM